MFLETCDQTLFAVLAAANGSGDNELEHPGVAIYYVDLKTLSTIILNPSPSNPLVTFRAQNEFPAVGQRESSRVS